MRCKNCGLENNPDNRFCFNCGTSLNSNLPETTDSSQNSDKISGDKLLNAYINTPNKFLWYRRAFKKYEEDSSSSFKWVWSWWAFLGGPLFLFYRKCYLEGFIYWGILFLSESMAKGSGIFLNAIAGGILPFFIYKRFKKTLLEVEDFPSLEKKIKYLKIIGGSNTTALYIFIVLNIIALIFGFLKAL